MLIQCCRPLSLSSNHFCIHWVALSKNWKGIALLFLPHQYIPFSLVNSISMETLFSRQTLVGVSTFPLAHSSSGHWIAKTCIVLGTQTLHHGLTFGSTRFLVQVTPMGCTAASLILGHWHVNLKTTTFVLAGRKVNCVEIVLVRRRGRICRQLCSWTAPSKSECPYAIIERHHCHSCSK